jgi:hypothetical protein
MIMLEGNQIIEKSGQSIRLFTLKSIAPLLKPCSSNRLLTAGILVGALTLLIYGPHLRKSERL